MTAGWKRIGGWIVRGIIAVVASVLIVVAGYWLWYAKLRSQPTSFEHDLFEGIHYRRLARSEPVPVVIHRVTVRLGTEGLRFFVTPPDRSEGRSLRGQTVGQFLVRHHLQVAVNGDFFQPWYSDTPWDYYPEEGEPVDPLGFAASNGEIYMQGRGKAATLYVSCDHIPSFRRPENLCYAVSGSPLVVKGEVVTDRSGESLQPRTAAGLDERGTKLLLVVVDGRQPGYSVGMTLSELGYELVQAGAWDAINLDGGGSSTLVAAGPHGDAEVLSSPIHTRIVGRQRPVANHFGVSVLHQTGSH